MDPWGFNRFGTRVWGTESMGESPQVTLPRMVTSKQLDVAGMTEFGLLSTSLKAHLVYYSISSHPSYSVGVPKGSVLGPLFLSSQAHLKNCAFQYHLYSNDT